MVAVAGGHIMAVLLLLNMTANVNAVDIYQRTALHRGVRTWLLIDQGVEGVTQCQSVFNNITVEPHLTATSLVRSPRHYGQPCSVPNCIPQCKE